MNTGTIPTQRTPDKPFGRLIVLEPISKDPEENLEPYEDELRTIFGFVSWF